VVKELGLEKHAGGTQPLLYRPVGCPQCNGAGYAGRIAILEMMPMSDRIRTLVMKHANATDLRQAAIADGMQPMFEYGIQKALAGVTTIEEVVRATREG
jgi:general secretion pathway protein E